VYFLIIALIVATAGSAVTIKTLIGYSPINAWLKVLISFLIILGWTAPLYSRFLRKAYAFLGDSYPYISNAIYILFGFVFILFILLVFRDFVWFLGWHLSRIWTDSDCLNPRNSIYIGKANLIVVCISVVATVWAVWEGTKIPHIKTITIENPHIDKEYRFVMLSDLHITRSIPQARISKIVAKTNKLKPDAVFLVGDIIDDRTKYIGSQLEELKELKAPLGIYAVSGNHELYNGLNLWQRNFKRLGIKVLINDGIRLKDSKVFVAGIPDLNTAFSPYFRINFAQAFQKSRNNDYKILLSHYPNLSEYPNRKYNLQLSGHTHGGQIFPFHYLSWQANKYLAGLYDVESYKLYVSRGAGYWGPPMRLFAPSEITEIILKPTKKSS